MKDRSILALLAGLAITSIAAGAEVGYYSQPALHGDRIVFVSEGDLWTATIPGSEEDAGPIVAYRLTSGDGAEYMPRLSPDGSSIAFAGQYDGNTDVYVMPIDGGAPERLTFHPSADEPLAWTPDGRDILFRSPRAHPLGRAELWKISTAGGMPSSYDFGPCSMINLSSSGSRFAFTRWSNENWSWKRYRGGTAPEIWLGDFSTGSFAQLTDHEANDLFPMWMLGRVFFLSDRAGTANIFSDSGRGGDIQQHTDFAPVEGNPQAIEGYDVRWPSADAQHRGTRIVFAQAGGLALLDITDNSIRRLDIRLASDRVAARTCMTDPTETMTEYSLSPDGSRLLVGSRGEVFSIDIELGQIRQLTRTSNAREWGAAYLGDKTIVLITDLGGQQQIATLPADGSEPAGLVTEDREVWLFPPATSPDGRWCAFGDKTTRLHLLDMVTLQRKQIDQAEAGEITDYRFSPDSQWLAYSTPMPNGMSSVSVYSLRTGRSFTISDGLHSDYEPRWDPEGKYLYFLSNRNLNPVLGEMDFEHVFINTAGVYAVPLAAVTPPPSVEAARAVGFDIDTWAGQPAEKKADSSMEKAPAEAVEAAEAQGMLMQIDMEGIATRVYQLPIEPGIYDQLEAITGGVVFISREIEGLMDEVWPAPSLGLPNGALHIYGVMDDEDKVFAEQVSGYAIDRERLRIVFPTEDGFSIIDLEGEPKPQPMEIKPTQLKVDVQAEWGQIFDEAWRLQRDFYWAPNHAGADWSAMYDKYHALLQRIGTRVELNDLIGQLIGELSTSHTYVWGGQEHDSVEPVSVGLLGADIEMAGGMFKITRILPGRPWEEDLISPLAGSYLGVSEGDVILEVNEAPLNYGTNIFELLQDQAGKTVLLTVSDPDGRTNRRTVAVKAVGGERALRYAAWVENNRRAVDEASNGALGYLHIPDMGGDGLVEFARLFYPQFDKKGLVIDVRDNGGGFVSQMIIQRLARKPITYSKMRHGAVERYPVKSVLGHMAVLIDQHAGSDGDIFPDAFRRLELGPLIGTRTWGGVVGIRADKPFIDLGISTQPEFALWDDQGWPMENIGVSPDIEVDLTPMDIAAGRDSQLDKAIEVLLEKLETEPTEAPPMPPFPVRE